MVRYITENEDETVYEPSPPGYLVLMVGGRGSQVFPLRGTIHLGRDKSNSVVVADHKVSRHHATLTPIDDTFILIDQGSANGTYLNGVLVSQPSRLKHSDKILLGDTEFLFSTSAPNLDLLNQGQAAPLNVPPVAIPGTSVTLFGLGSGSVWLLVGCLAMIVVALLLALVLLLGVFVGRMQFGLLPALHLAIASWII